MSRVNLNIINDSIYANGKIYVIKSTNTDEIYIGSTCLDLSVRLNCHLQNYTQNRTFCTSYYILNAGNYYIELLEKYPCNTKQDLLFREQQWINYYSNIAVNENEAYVSTEESINRKIQYQKDHIAEKSRTDKILYQKKREKLLEKVNCPTCNKLIARASLLRHRKTIHNYQISI